MKNITLGRTDITAPQNGFGALPVQRVSKEQAVALLLRAYEEACGFLIRPELTVTARRSWARRWRLSPGELLSGVQNYGERRRRILGKQLDTSLSLLKTDYLDIYQFHCADTVFRPGDGTGMYECMEEAKRQGKIRHIGITAHKLQVAWTRWIPGLYETLQFPFSYLSSAKEMDLVRRCAGGQYGIYRYEGIGRRAD